MSTVVFKKRSATGTNKKIIKRTKVADDSSEEEDDIVKAKAKQSNAGITVKETKQQKAELRDLDVVYSGDRSTTNNNINDSTRQVSNIDGHLDDELLGTNSQRAIGEADKKTIKGPVRAPANIRAISVIDYQPDVCKDYKQTGYCGFGDTCKFLHDRGEFKQGWQLDKDWEEAARSKKTGGGTDRPKKGEDKDESEIPFKCIICKDDYKNPIITKCGHYFCEACALNRFKKTPACAHCNAGTGGLFSGAAKLKNLLAAKQARIAAKDNAIEGE